MTSEQKAWIDGASYYQLLERWRNAPVGSPWFVGDTGDYYAKVMGERREQVSTEEHVQTSKSIGWGGSHD